jgi:hypothetical protein
VVLGTYDPTTINPPTGEESGVVEVMGSEIISVLERRGFGRRPLLAATKEAAVRKRRGGGGTSDDSLCR